MQRVAIFQFNWGQRFALLFIFALSVLAGTLFVNPSHANAATTYKTETSGNIATKIKALKYYAALQSCTQGSGGNWKTGITGDDIEFGPRRWINGGGPSVSLGQYADNFGNKDGETGCSGESDDTPGWVNDMFSVFGLTYSSSKRDTLSALGYNCPKTGNNNSGGGTYTCTNKDINSSSSKKGILYQVRNGPYLNGVNPLTEQPDYDAMYYYLAMNALTTNNLCNAQKGGSNNLVTVAEVGDGTIIKSDWGIKNDQGTTRLVDAGFPPNGNFDANETCGNAAKATVTYAQAYLDWVSPSACASTFPDKATDQNFLYGCGKGRANLKNYTLCATNDFNRNSTISDMMKNACFMGQGLPVNSDGISSGMLCYNTAGYTSTTELTACINGSLNKSDTNYCYATYPVPPVGADANAANRAACQIGQTLKVSGGGVPTDGSLKDAGAAAGDDKTSCGISGIGWLVCPVISFTGDLLSHAFAGLADNFLVVDTGLFNTTSGTYTAWAIFRNFANVAFVIVFLIIIFSQLTGLGVSNYGVKKLLPRIIVAAILVNISYFICQLAVDLSNVLGYSLKDVFDGIAISSGVPTSASASGDGFGIAGIITAVIATSIVAYFALGVLIPIILGALVSVIMVVLMLIARKAIIILLIVLSPLAFVAFLLPNTEPLFTKWRKAFMALLLLFPIISVVFGMSSLASQIVLKAGPGTGGSQVILQIMAVGIVALPLFFVPVLLKGSLNGIGTIGAKLNGFAAKSGGALGKAGSKGYENTALSRGRAIRKQGRAEYRNQKFAKSIAKNGPRAFFARGANVIGAQKYANASLERKALSTAQKAKQEDIEAAGIKVDAMKADRPSLRTMAHGGGAGSDSAVQAAAIQRTVASNDVKGMNDLWDASKTWTGPKGDEMRQVLARSMEASSGRPTYFGAGAIAALKLNNHNTAKKTVTDAVSTGAYSPAKIAAADQDELNVVAETANSNTDPTFLAAHQKLVDDAHTALTDPELRRTIGKNLDNVTNIRNNSPPPTPLA